MTRKMNLSGRIEIPYALSFLGFRNIDAFVPGIDDLVLGNEQLSIESSQSKLGKGKMALNALRDYKEAQHMGDTPRKEDALALFRSNEAYLGYGYLDSPEKIIPPVALTFYSFHIMVGLGSWFLALFFFVLYFSMNR